MKSASTWRVYAVLLLCDAAICAKVETTNSSVSHADETCYSIANADDCVNYTYFGVHECTYCSVEDQCHATGSLLNHCSNQCCASKSSLSVCKWSSPEQIDYPDGECSQASNPSNTTPYDVPTALRLYAMAGASYCSPAAVNAWTCKPCQTQNEVSNITTITVGDFQVVALYDKVLQATVVAFRGTVASRLTNWIADLNTKFTAPYSDQSIKVHKGFYTTFQTLYINGLAADLKARGTLTPIIFTGHSLGAAMATLCAKTMKDLGYSVRSIYNFGSPRAGNFAFHNNIKSLLPNTWRLTHHLDVVPHLPPQDTAYYHIHNEIYYAGEDSNTYRVCDSSGEDGSCSDQCMLCTSVDDHLTYFGIYIGTNAC